MTVHDASQSASATAAQNSISAARRLPLRSRYNSALPSEFTRRETFAELLPFIVSAALALGIIVAILASTFNVPSSQGVPDRPALTHYGTAPGGLFARSGLGDAPRERQID